MDSNTPKITEQLLKQYFHNKKFKEAYQEEKTEFIKGLEVEIGDELRTRINKIKGRFILLVGKSVKASEAVGRYAYCIKGHTTLNYYSFSGKTDERIENILNTPEYYDGEDKFGDGNIVDCLSSGGAVFLGDLECHDRPLLKRLAEGIRNVKYGNNDKGLLIISTTNDRDSVPEYFKELFEVIRLEPEKQNTPASTPNGNLFHREGDYWTIRYKDKLIRLKHCKGLDCIAYLLENENKDLWAYEVVQAIDKDQFQKDCTKIKDKKDEDVFFDESGACEEGLTIIKDSGLNEKYRKRISASMGISLNKIKEQNKDLWQHLNSAINPGKSPSYKPKESQGWTVKR